MADTLVADPPPLPDPHPNPSSDFDCLPVPPLDPPFFSADADPNSDPMALPQLFKSDIDLDFVFEDDGSFDFSFDDLYLPDENEPFLIPSAHETLEGINYESGSSGVSGNQISIVDGYLNYSPAESGSYGSRDHKVDDGKALRFPSAESDHSGEREFYSEPVSSQGSGNGGGGSGLSDDMNSPSPRSGNFDRDVSSQLGVDQKVETEETSNGHGPKRKKEENYEISEIRTTKCRRSSGATANVGNSQCTNEEEEKRKARLMRNRESAQLSRQRKKHYVEELEDKVRSMNSTIAELKSKISFVMAENVNLRQQLGGGGGMCPPPPPGMYPAPPMAQMAYPWAPCPPYVMKPQGSQVPLVPIPRLKPQQPVSSSKVKKAENKKTEGKTKKVASISFLGLFFCILLFGGLFPTVHVRFGGTGDRVPGRVNYFGDRYHDHHRGRILTLNGHRNGSYYNTGRGSCDGSDCAINQERVLGGPEYEIATKQGSMRGNSSEPLVASLYVPRNDKLVKIDGNLIIHSVLASEKAMTSHLSQETKSEGATDPRTRQNLVSALALPEAARGNSHLYGKPTKRQRALASGNGDPLEDHGKSTPADGKLQQWFREGLAGPLLSSGLCTEVFQFDFSPASAKGAIVPASQVGNISSEHRRNTTHVSKGTNRRFLRKMPHRLAGSNLNRTGDEEGRHGKREDLQSNKSLSSMVVSVLVDPRDAGGSDDGVIPPKSMSRIFVVVLLDSIKYVTYSCVLPRAGPQLVTT